MKVAEPLGVDIEDYYVCVVQPIVVTLASSHGFLNDRGDAVGLAGPSRPDNGNVLVEKPVAMHRYYYLTVATQRGKTEALTLVEGIRVDRPDFCTGRAVTPPRILAARLRAVRIGTEKRHFFVTGAG